MQIIFWIMFAVTIVVAGFYWIKYEKECQITDSLKNTIHEMKGGLKEKEQVILIGDIVQDYRKDMTYSNACTAMRKICDIILSKK